MSGARVAVVTGGARRIGAAIARSLHAEGYTVCLHYRHSERDARQLAEQLNEQRPDSCHLFCADLSREADVREFARACLSRFERIDLLVNNASGFFATPIADSTPDQFDDLLGSNLKGPYFLCQAILPGLRRGGGSIVNIIDTHVDRPLPGFTVYGAAKAGLANLTRGLAVELAPDIRVNGVAPGAILWPEDDGAYDEERRLKTIGETPLARLGEPADIARAVVFLAGDAPFVTGQVLKVDGGRSLT